MRYFNNRRNPFGGLLNFIEGSRTTDRLVLRLAFFVMIFSGLAFLVLLNNSYIEEVPGKGGTMTEGIVGIPRFVNPALAITRADQDAVALLYSGLLRLSPEGKLVPDLAESITVSEDGTVYNIVMRRDARFHDDTPITARDAIFTISLFKDSELKSPLRGNWTDVTVEEIGEYEFNIVLTEAYTPFLENFTFGIMPSHIWSELPVEQLPFSQYNTEPIGSGPFLISRVMRDGSGLIDGYVLRPASNQLETPNLSSIELKFYQNEEELIEAFLAGEVMNTAYLPTSVTFDVSSSTDNLIEEPLPRVFGVFFNQNRSTALRDKAVREALSMAINRQELIDQNLLGYGVPTELPLLSSGVKLSSVTTSNTNSTTTLEIATAEEILLDGGWSKNNTGRWVKTIDGSEVILRLALSTSNSSLFDDTARALADVWRELGVEVEVEMYEQAGLVQSVIRTRNFEALLFGMDLNRGQDLYPFWHSSQQNDPGLNIAQYTNITVDDLLESARSEMSSEEAMTNNEQAAFIIASEYPAIFLFAPTFVYVTDNTITTVPMKRIADPAERFMNISKWYAKTNSLWSWFTPSE